MGQESNRTLARQQALRDQIPPSTVAGLLRMAGRDLQAGDAGEASTEAADSSAEATLAPPGEATGAPAEATGAQPAGATGAPPAEAAQASRGEGIAPQRVSPEPEQPATARQARPSWPRVIATTTRLWMRRHLRHPTRQAAPTPPMSSAEFVRTGERQSIPRRPLMIGLIAVAAAIIVAGVLIVAVPRHTATPTPAPAQAGAGPLGAIATVRHQTAAWVAGQVSRSAIVACDPVMCSALQAQGLAAQNLLILPSAASDPLGSDVIVATAAVRSKFGSRLASVYAPTVIASFGSGAAQIDVRAVAPDGAAAYQAALHGDQSARRTAGAQLLGNKLITAAPASARALAGGEVDSRLLIMIAALAARYPLRLVAFGTQAPGASPEVPLSSVDVAATATQGAAEIRLVQDFLQAQLPPYHPLRLQMLAAGPRPVLRIEFGAPSPLGLLGAHV
jgi:hypothetical protein